MLGAARNIVTIVIASRRYGELLSRAQIAGYAVALFGFIYYSFAKSDFHKSTFTICGKRDYKHNSIGNINNVTNSNNNNNNNNNGNDLNDSNEKQILSSSNSIHSNLIEKESSTLLDLKLNQLELGKTL